MCLHSSIDSIQAYCVVIEIGVKGSSANQALSMAALCSLKAFCLYKLFLYVGLLMGHEEGDLGCLLCKWESVCAHCHELPFKPLSEQGLDTTLWALLAFYCLFIRTHAIFITPLISPALRSAEPTLCPSPLISCKYKL